MLPSDIGAYRILVVDNEPDIHIAVEDEIGRISGPVPITFEHSSTAREAIGKVKAKYFDLMLLDLHFHDNDLGGYEVYRGLDKLTCSVEVLLMSHLDFGSEVKTLIRLFAADGGPRFVGFLDKREQHRDSLRKEVAKLYEHFLGRNVTIENLDLPVSMILERRHRYQRPGSFPLRESPIELGVEVNRLIRDLYVHVPVGRRSSEVSIELAPIDRHGLSAAIVVNANVHISLSRMDPPRSPHKTVLKIGPKGEILEEAARYQEFVRFGVELDERVELLGVGCRDSLGGIVYSFAGGVHRKDLLSLDEILVDDIISGNLEVSRQVLERLFASRHWYSLTAEPVRLGDYFAENYRTDLTRSASQGIKYLEKLPAEIADAATVERLSQPKNAQGYRISVTIQPVELAEPSVGCAGC
ncbi:MAG: response regulator [Egibacteraceae bacterium]